MKFVGGKFTGQPFTFRIGYFDKKALEMEAQPLINENTCEKMSLNVLRNVFGRYEIEIKRTRKEKEVEKNWESNKRIITQNHKQLQLFNQLNIVVFFLLFSRNLVILIKLTFYSNEFSALRVYNYEIGGKEKYFFSKEKVLLFCLCSLFIKSGYFLLEISPPRNLEIEWTRRFYLFE